MQSNWGDRSSGVYFHRFASALTQEKRFTSRFFMENVCASRKIEYSLGYYTSVQTGSEVGVMDMKT